MLENRLTSNRHQWLELFCNPRNPRINRQKLAAPFLSCSLSKNVPILYVGKATGGDWHMHKFRGSVAERLKCTRDWVAAIKRNEYTSAFWRFAVELSQRASNDSEALSNITWTNLCKIGVKDGNPVGEYLTFQHELAVETLGLEIKLYRPKLVVFVTGDYAADVVLRALGDMRDTSWRKKSDMWWREARDSYPAMIWTAHPQGSTREAIKIWLRYASELMR